MQTLLDTNENALVLDVFLLCLDNESNDTNSTTDDNDHCQEKDRQLFVALADLAVALNVHCQTASKLYPWLSGGDGLVFGVHCSTSSRSNSSSTSTSRSSKQDLLQPSTAAATATTTMVPHLRAVCRYGVSVADEWYAIQILLHYDPTPQRDASVYRMVTECWDVTDGQILLVQAAHQLPSWMEDLTPDQCRHRCWIWHQSSSSFESNVWYWNGSARSTTTTAAAALTTTTTNDRTTSTHPSGGGEFNGGSSIYLLQPIETAATTVLSLHEALAVWHDHIWNSPPRPAACSVSFSATTNGTASPQPTTTTTTRTTTRVVQASDAVHQAIGSAMAVATHRDETLVSNSNNKCDTNPNRCHHRAAVAVPRCVAGLFRRRPDLVAPACRMFVEQATTTTTTNQDRRPDRRSNHNVNHQYDAANTEYLAGRAHDWVWTTLDFGRTAYAMLRTVTASPSWTQEDSIFPPTVASNIQVKQMRRICAVESTPHLRYSLALGVRLVAGLDACLQLHHQRRDDDNNIDTTDGLSVAERRVTRYWSNLWQNCHLSRHPPDDWIRQAWRDGPNEARYKLESMMHCPVFHPEIEHSLTPLSDPDTALPDQIRQELLRHDRTKTDDEWVLNLAQPPHSKDVDDEAWLFILPSQHGGDDDIYSNPLFNTVHDTSPPEKSKPDAASLDALLQGVQSFLVGESSVEGVETAPTAMSPNDSDSVAFTSINPVVFLNMLHATLQAPSDEALVTLLYVSEEDTMDFKNQSDPYFSSEDYDLMMPSNDDVIQDDMVKVDDLQTAMNAMDAELRGTSTNLSREWDTAAVDMVDAALGVGRDTDSKRTALDVHVVSHLLQSLSESQGGPGPIQNILQEIHIPAPDVLSHMDDEDEVVDEDKWEGR